MSEAGGIGKYVRRLFARPGQEPGLAAGQEERLPAAPGPREDGPKSVVARLGDKLARTRDVLVGRVEALVRRRAAIDPGFFQELEEILLQADIGVRTTARLLSGLNRRMADEKPRGRQPDVIAMLKEEILEILGPREPLRTAPSGACVVMVVGVNGTGKTTTVGKLGHRFRKKGARVVVGATDTFRAAAIEQLGIWAARVGVEFIRHEEGGDPAAVAYDACQAAKARMADYVILDTAGRLHTRVNLMEELKKVRRVVGREIPGAPHEVLLVLDASSGQNALAQARTFGEAVDVTGIALAKLDGTAKGGIILAIREELGIPVKLIGTGEGADDLEDFDPVEFADALFAPCETR